MPDPARCSIPPLGQGTWHMGERDADRASEADALRLGITLGMTLIDTAEMYADGGAEEVVASAIEGRRDQVFLVSKAYPQNAGSARLAQACERSLKRLRTDHIDLYLLHWRGTVPLAETVAAFGSLVARGLIGAWGVSNFDVDDMEELLAAGGTACAANQVLYNLASRGIGFDLLPWCRQRSIPVMAYSPVGQGGRLLRSPALAAVAARHGVTPAQAAIAWTLQPGVVSIPKAADPIHVRQNAAAAAVRLTEADHATLDAAYKPPARKQPLEML